ncbi:MAG: TIGR00730 family Rossman fold protein [Acidobacteria bacterium]|nr:MAG: TIGR00730 family Rossman fold protein [Acidobacteriota bacterium]
MRRVAVFCGSSPGRDGAYRAAAEALGKTLAERRLGLVYGGGDVGLMGILADAVMAAGGEVIGVIPQALKARELAHLGLTRLEVVDSMHSRKERMYQLADALIALPGGIGTFEELLESLTWIQLGLHAKPCGVLNVGGYYDPLLAQLERAVAHGFLRPEHRGLLIAERDPVVLLERFADYRPPQIRKWIDEGET